MPATHTICGRGDRLRAAARLLVLAGGISDQTIGQAGNPGRESCDLMDEVAALWQAQALANRVHLEQT